MTNLKKGTALLLITAIYLFAYAVSFLLCRLFAVPMLWQYLLFDVFATVIVFVFSVELHNSSVYDPYWSVTPLVMALWLFISSRAFFSAWQVAFLAVFCLWGVRLTANWVTVFTGFSYEDWRYRKYREDNTPAMWFFLNFTGIHMIPTLVVFAGMLPLFEIVSQKMSALSMFGLAVMLWGIGLEFFADRQMHTFLATAAHGEVCKVGLWRLSRHPNYLGEISFWAGVFLVMLPFAPQKWYYVIGFVAVTVLFNVVSIPLAEKRQLSRREAYIDYCRQTSRLLLLPSKAEKEHAVL